MEPFGVRRLRALLVHFYTACGVIFALLATVEVASAAPDPRLVFVWLLVAVFIDATDGPLARRFQVKLYAPDINGRTIDDLVDYLTFTFVPLLLVWRMGWVPEPATAWIAPALIASLFGFANTGAKYEADGFFRGFPSYWNVYALYAGLWATRQGPLGPGVLLLALSVLTVLPIRMLYPNLAPRPWRGPVLGGALIWALLLVGLLPHYPAAPDWLIGLSLVYPAFYVVLSVVLDVRLRRRARRETI